jgi:hypothetical protein
MVAAPIVAKTPTPATPSTAIPVVSFRSSRIPRSRAPDPRPSASQLCI